MKLKLSVPQWHYSMLLDRDRVAVFKEAIENAIKTWLGPDDDYDNDFDNDISWHRGGLGF